MGRAVESSSRRRYLNSVFEGKDLRCSRLGNSMSKGPEGQICEPWGLDTVGEGQGAHSLSGPELNGDGCGRQGARHWGFQMVPEGHDPCSHCPFRQAQVPNLNCWESLDQGSHSLFAGLGHRAHGVQAGELSPSQGWIQQSPASRERPRRFGWTHPMQHSWM